MRAFEHVAARDAREALAALALEGAGAGRAAILAGGTDLVPLMQDGLVAPERLVSVQSARDLRYLRFEADGALHIGALTTLADIERNAELSARLPILALAVRDAATPQLRVMATVGGNLMQRNRCWYFRGQHHCWLKGGDTCFARDGENKYQAIFDQGPCVAVHPSDLAPALVALEATMEIERPGGRRVIPVTELLAPPSAERRIEHRLGAEELIVEVHVPAQPEGAQGVYLKAMDRQAWAFALVSAAAQVTVRDGKVERARMALGGVANVPWRVPEAEALLEGQALTPELAIQAAERLVVGATPLAHNGYKVAMARELARRAILAAGQQR
jgi:xanthine dehydrogenase YagS FAD-binding subunit